MAKNRNPRRVVLAIMRIVSQNLRAMLSSWNQDQTNHAEHRPLRSNEKIENQAAEWDQLARYCTAMIGQLEDVRSVARAQYMRCAEGKPIDVEMARKVTDELAKIYEV